MIVIIEEYNLKPSYNSLNNNDNINNIKWIEQSNSY